MPLLVEERVIHIHQMVIPIIKSIILMISEIQKEILKDFLLGEMKIANKTMGLLFMVNPL